MDKFTRIYHLHQLLVGRRTPLALVDIQNALECSESTARRTIASLRDTLGAPLEYDRDRNGYFYDTETGETYELPGLWFTAEEVHALLVSHQLLDNLQPGILSAHISPLRNRLQQLLSQQHAGHPEIAKRIRILQMASRPTEMRHFQAVASAVVKRRQLHVLYHGRERDQTTERTVSPQRLVYYRSNWYLDAFCHLRCALRSFSLDRLQPVEIKEEPALDVPSEELDEHFASSYGIFAGKPDKTAHLRFSPTAARWVADEQWHPWQEGNVLQDGSYELKIPYSDPRELILDILKYGPDVEVISPLSLRDAIRQKLRQAIKNYTE